jgi:hypothetical protein
MEGRPTFYGLNQVTLPRYIGQLRRRVRVEFAGSPDELLEIARDAFDEPSRYGLTHTSVKYFARSICDDMAHPL